MKVETILEGYTFDDVLLIPQKSSVIPSQVDVKTKLTKTVTLNVPLMSAAMDTVTESRLAIAMAREGGMGIIHKNMPIEEQASNVDKVKRSEHGVITDPFSLSPEHLIEDANQLMSKYHISGVPITEGGKLVGILTNRDLRFETDYTRKIKDVMTSENLVTGVINTTLAEAQEILRRHKIEKLPLIDAKGYLKGLITIKDIEKAIQYPNSAKDINGRLLAGAAVGTSADTMDRVAALYEAKVDAVTVDSAHGHTENVMNTIKAIKKKYPSLVVIGGNVATAEAVRDMIEAGVDCVKVGMGAGLHLHHARCGRHRRSAVFRRARMRPRSGEIRYTHHRGRRHQIFGRYHQGAGSQRFGRDDRRHLCRYGGKPGRNRDIPGPQLQGIPRHGLYGGHEKGFQRPLFPGGRGKARPGRRGRARAFQRPPGGHGFPTGRRP